MRNVAHALTACFIIGSLLSFLAVRPAQARGLGGLPVAALQNEVVTEELQASLVVDPPAGQLGDTFTVTLLLANSGATVRTPELTITGPANAQFDTASLPAGTAVDLQNAGISWFPVLPAGETRTFTLPFQVDATNLEQPTQSVVATLVDDGQEQRISADFWIGVLPTAEILLTPARAGVGQPVRLMANVEGPGPLTQAWRLGDGRYLEANDPTVVYPTAGTYTVTLDVRNPLGVAQATTQVIVMPETVSSFGVEDRTPGPNQPVNFLNQSGGQPPLSYRWEFGDGATSAEQNPTHRYTAPGQYEVTLVTSNTFGSDISSMTLFVGAPPQVEVQLPAEARLGDPLIGQANGDGTITSFRWEMGDGATYDGPIVNHEYVAAGDYLVTLTAANEYAATTVTRTVTVARPAWQLFLPTITRGATAAPPAEAAAETRTVPDQLAPLRSDATPAEQLLWFINEARRIHNLPPLDYSYELSIAAQQHAEDMAVNAFTGHVGSDGSRPPERLLRVGYTGSYAGEATAWGYNDPVPVVEFWVNSPGHRAIILNPEATEVGLGFGVNYNAPSVWYWTIEFGVNRPTPPQ